MNLSSPLSNSGPSGQPGQLSGLPSGPGGKLREKLLGAGEGFRGFDKVLEQNANARLAGEEEHRTWLKYTLQRLEFTLYTEIRRRVEASKTLQQMTEELSNDLYSSLQSKIDHHLERLGSDLDNLARRCNDLEEVGRGSNHDNTRIKRLHRHIDILGSCVDALKTSFEEEKAKSLSSVTAYVGRMTRISDTIENNFEGLMSQDQERQQYLARELQNLNRMSASETTEEEFHSYCLEAIQCLRKKAERAELARKKQDEVIVEAIERYAHTLQRGLGNENN